MRVEDPIHKVILNYLRAVLPYGFLPQHTPNKPRSAVAGKREKEMGAVAGWPDLAVYGRKDDQPAVWFFEVKAPKGRLSDEQIDVHDQLTDIGHPVAVVRSINDVRAALRKWNVPNKDACL